MAKAAGALALSKTASEVPAQDPGNRLTISSALSEDRRPSVDNQGHPPENSSLHPNASTTTIAQIKRIRRQSSVPNQMSHPGPRALQPSVSFRRSSYSSAEAKRLLTISTTAVARAHHHWLRPCDACVRKAEGGTGRKMERNRLRKAIPSEDGISSRFEREEKMDGMVKKTIGWVKKQEGKMKYM